MVSGHCQPCYNHKSVMLYIQTPSQTCKTKLVGQPCNHSGDTMSHDIHSTLGVSYHGTIGAQSSIHLGVLSGVWYCEGSALGLHVGACHCSRFGAWSTCWHPTRCLALQWVQHLVHIRPPHPILVDHQQTASKERHNNKRLGPKEASQTKYSSSNLQRRAFMIAHNLSCRAKPGSAIKIPLIKPSQLT